MVDIIKSYKIIADERLIGRRIDNIILAEIDVPRSHVYKMLRRGEVRVNKGRIKASYRVNLNDEIRIPPYKLEKQKTIKFAHNISLERQILDNILYQDADFLVINKPSGIAVHGGSGLSYGLINIIRNMDANNKKFDLIHRLDKDTSGCLMIAKNMATLKKCHELLQNGQIKKKYLALTHGNWNKAVNKITTPLSKRGSRDGERLVMVDYDDNFYKKSRRPLILN